MRTDSCKPSPDELLRRVEADALRESRGRLKVFLGYAPRVGKSFRMFEEGRRRKERGQDVVVGAVQGAAPAESLKRLEIVPTAREVIDVAALLRRRPEVCLVDGLAQHNPPGSRNPQRWQDVQELLNSGIGVITALNVQHIREKQDEVESITGKRATYSVPFEFLRSADEIEVVDAPPDALLNRAGAAGMPDARRLGELRELALLLAADVVDRQLQDYLEAHGITGHWVAQERILVCLTPRSNAGDMLRSGQRNAERFHGALLAAYVDQGELGGEDRLRLNANLELARSLGADTHRLRGSDFVTAILEFAREQRITQIFIGHSQRARSPIDRLIDAAEDFDVRVFPQRSGP
jgi:two-component system sensor histidine kinase KdpD